GSPSAYLRPASAKSPAQELRFGEPETPGHIGGPRDADPRTTHHLDRHVGRPQVEGRGIDRHSGMPEIDAERLAYPPGPGAEQPRRIHATARAHGIEAMERLDRPDQHPGPMPLF